jgi:dTMP kinase
VGLCAGVSWIIGYTLIGFEVEDRLRGRVFAFVISSVRVVLLLAVAVGPGLAGLLGTHDVRLGDLVLTLTGPGLTLLVGGGIALLVSAYATRQVVPARSRTRVRDVLRLLWGRSDLFSASSSGIGLFVVVEGADRELTRRYTADLARVLRDCGCPVEVTAEPSDTRLGRQVRDLLFPAAPGSGTGVPRPRPAVDDTGRPLTAHTAALLAAADRAQHVATVIRPALEANRVVVDTHYVDTSIAFHGAGQGLDGDRILRTSLWSTHGLLPDLTVVVDSPVTSAPAGADAEAVRRAFLALAEAAPDRYVVVPGELLDTGADEGLVSPVVRRRLAALVATRYPSAAGEEPVPAGPATPGAAPAAAGERAGRSVG